MYEEIRTPYRDVQQVCLNGHQITDSVNKYPQDMKEYCPKCGAKTITKCPKCNEPIPGHIYYEGVFRTTTRLYPEPVPSYCHKCGSPYPWTENAISNIKKDSNFDPMSLIEKLCTRFHLVAKQLRNRYGNRQTLEVSDEHDVQDLFHSLLKIFFDDIRPEEYTPSYGGKSSRMDFLLKEHQIVIETKMTRKGLGVKEIASQLNDDINRYSEHPDCKTLICFVYDPEGLILNPVGLEKDLSKKQKGLNVKILIRPRG